MVVLPATFKILCDIVKGRNRLNDVAARTNGGFRERKPSPPLQLVGMHNECGTVATFTHVCKAVVFVCVFVLHLPCLFVGAAVDGRETNLPNPVGTKSPLRSHYCLRAFRQQVVQPPTERAPYARSPLTMK